jgi:hypothetical protein
LTPHLLRGETHHEFCIGLMGFAPLNPSYSPKNAAAPQSGAARMPPELDDQ